MKYINIDGRSSIKVHGIEGSNKQKSRRLEDIRRRLTEYTEELYNRENQPNNIATEDKEEVEEVYLRPVLLETEIEKAMKEQKALGEDDIAVEMLRILEKKVSTETYTD